MSREGEHKKCVNSHHPLLLHMKNCLLSILTLLGYLTVVTINIPIYIFRVVVIYLAKCFRPELGPCLNAMSSYFANDLFSGKSPRCTTIVQIVVKGKLTKKELLYLVRKNWINAIEEETGDLKYPQFRNHICWWLGFPFWKTDQNFNVENHVFSYTEEVTNNSGTVVTEDDLNNFVEKLINAPYQYGKSQWELHVVENYRNGKYPTATANDELSVMVMRNHHSLADGYSLLDALVAGLVEIDIKEMKLPNKAPRVKPTVWQKLSYYATIPVMAAYEFSVAFSNFFRECPWKASDSVKQWNHRYAKSGLIPIENVKHIKNVLGVSFTSVLLSVISAGIYKNLEAKRKNNTMRVEIEGDSMLCMTALPLPETPATKKIRLKNNVTGMFFQVPVNGFPTSVDRLRKCDEILEACQNSVIPAVSIAYVNSVGWMMGNMGYTIGKNRMISTGLTNFPTKQNNEKFGYLAGHEVVFSEFASGTLVGDAGVGFMIVSYYPHIQLTVTSESSILSREEINELVKYIEDEFNMLYSIANTIKPNCSN